MSVLMKVKENSPVQMTVSDAVPVGNGGGNIFSPEINTIRVIEREDYEALPTPRPSTTAYLIKG